MSLHLEFAISNIVSSPVIFRLNRDLPTCQLSRENISSYSGYRQLFYVSQTGVIVLSDLAAGAE